MARGHLNAEGLVVRWPRGPQKMSDRLLRITVNGTDRRVVFLQPKDERGVADAARIEQTPKRMPAVRAKALKNIRPGRVLTLSEQQLILLDWNSSNHRGARVKSKKAVAGPGVEFDVHFPSNRPGSCSLSFVSTGTGGRGSLVGTNVRGYDAFALKLTLVSVNGQTQPERKQTLVAGAVIGPTPEGRLTGYEPVTLSLAASEKTVTAMTPVSTDGIYEVGFHIHVLDYQDWDESGSRIVLRVEPAQDGRAWAFNTSKR
jgi:hypothetical protein